MSSRGNSNRDPVGGEGATAPLPPQDSRQQTDAAARKPLLRGGATSPGAALTTHPERGTHAPPKPHRPPAGDLQSSQATRPPDAGPPSPINAAPPATAPAGQASPTTAEAASWELTREELRAAEVITEHKIAAARGWRKWLRVATFGLVTMQQSPESHAQRSLGLHFSVPHFGSEALISSIVHTLWTLRERRAHAWISAKPHSNLFLAA